MDVVLYSLWSSNYTRRITGENLDTIFIDFFDLMAFYDNVTRLKMERNEKTYPCVVHCRSFAKSKVQLHSPNYVLKVRVWWKNTPFALKTK